MALELKKAQRTKAKLKLGISAPSGGGKTLGALLIAYGLMKEKYPALPENELWGKIAIIDTENGSGELYVGKEIANVKIGQYNAITLEPPFEADRYIDAIKLCKKAEMEVTIIDSTTHLWAGEGGLLQKQGEIAKRTGNSYTAWRDVTPQHNHFVDTMLQTDMHIIATMRSKVDYIQEKDGSGKTTIRKVGLAPIQKEGMEFEFTLFLDINTDHEAFVSKDRTSIYDQKTFKITPEVGATLMRWLESGTDGAKMVVATSIKAADLSDAVRGLKKEISKLFKEATPEKQEEFKVLFTKLGNPNEVTDPDVMKNILDNMKENN